MILRLALFLNVFFVVPVFAQEPVSFSEAISHNLAWYRSKADKAYRLQDVERAEFLFDSLVDHGLKGSRVDNFKIRNLKNKTVQLKDFKKPVFLITNSSWIVSARGEISALNELADKYHDQIDFVLLFWDDQKTTKELSKRYSKNISIFYVDEAANANPSVIKVMKHSLGFPTTFLLDSEKLVVDIRRKISHPYNLAFQKSFELNHDALLKGVSLLLIKESNAFTGTSGPDVAKGAEPTDAKRTP